jgi:hypothetical protein
LTYQKNSKNGFRFLVKVSLCQISALRVFSVAQNLGAKLGLQDFLQVAPESLMTKEKSWV